MQILEDSTQKNRKNGTLFPLVHKKKRKKGHLQFGLSYRLEKDDYRGGSKTKKGNQTASIGWFCCWGGKGPQSPICNRVNKEEEGGRERTG